MDEEDIRMGTLACVIHDSIMANMDGLDRRAIIHALLACLESVIHVGDPGNNAGIGVMLNVGSFYKQHDGARALILELASKAEIPEPCGKCPSCKAEKPN